MTRLTDEELATFSARFGEFFGTIQTADGTRRVSASELVTELLALRAEVARLRGADERAVMAVVRRTRASAANLVGRGADAAAGAVLAVADEIEANWRKWVAREGE